VFNDAGADVDFRVEGDTDANLLFVDASTDRVGIGTSSPQRPLHISAAIPAIRIEDSDTNAYAEVVSNNSGDLLLRADEGNTQASSAMMFEVDGTERMRITSAGEVLVGGTTEIGSTDGSLTIQKEGAPTLNFFRNDTTVVNPNPFGTINFYGNDTTSNTPTRLAFIQALAPEAHNPGDNPTNLVFGTTPDGSDTVREVMRIDSSGNVGIGTTSPTTPLYVASSTGDTSVKVETTFAGGDARLELIGNSGGVSQIRFGDEASANVGLLTYDHADNSMAFRVNAAERMRIDSSGNLLVGGTSTTTTPTLNKGVYLQSQTNNDVIGYSLYSNEGANNRRGSLYLDDANGIFGLATSASSGVPNITFSTGGNERMRIDSSGNVGIGTTSPAYPLQVNGDIDVQNTFIDNSTTGPTLRLGNQNSGSNLSSDTLVGGIRFRGRFNSTYSGPNDIASINSHYMGNGTTRLGDIRFSTSNAGTPAERMRITSAGEVLVGGTTEISSASGVLNIERSNTVPILSFFRNDTTISSGNTLGSIRFFGNDTTSNTPTQHAYIQAAASGAHAAGDNPTDLVFGTTPDGSATVAEVARFTESKYLRFASGTGGIQFNGDTAAANALDDYEEGTFTLKFADATSGGNESSSTLSGKYTKIGNVVYFVISVFNLSTAGLTSGNIAYITGFPFSNSGANAYAIPWTDTLNYDGYPMFQLAANQTYGSFTNCRDAATDTNILVSAFTSGVSDFYINGFYYVS
jgi:hypothetical protein